MPTLMWRNPKQSWVHSMHRIGPYVGRIKPAFAHFLIKYLTKSNDLVLDPFSGIGTICFESVVQNRNSIGCDINPYALAIAKAKANVKENLNQYIKKINKLKIETRNISLDEIPEWVKEYYNPETLKEIPTPTFVRYDISLAGKYKLFLSFPTSVATVRISHAFKSVKVTVPVGDCNIVFPTSTIPPPT